MACAIIIRFHDGFQSYLVLDENNPRELLRHWGFQEEFSARPWLGSLDPMDALEEWSEMLAEDPLNYQIADENHQVFRVERSCWDHVDIWPKI
ncbi:MAG: hypothetical protein FJ134_04415 [Deltaproteobacteria bacterium]|nr:hypothetical protein [Deltaproteobacteria bacterium]